MSKLVLDDKISADLLKIIQIFDDHQNPTEHNTICFGKDEIITINTILKLIRDKAIENIITDLVGIDL